ncbi:hypothetical protein YC2023_091701 [Brassica napus]
MYHVKENKSTYKLHGVPRKMKTTSSLVKNNTDINNTTSKIVLKDKEISYGGGSGSLRWAWGGGGGGEGGGGGGSGRGWGWGGGGGSGGWYKWGCSGGGREGKGEFVKREYAECKGKGKCGRMRMECPQHCGGGISLNRGKMVMLGGRKLEGYRVWSANREKVSVDNDYFAAGLVTVCGFHRRVETRD